MFGFSLKWVIFNRTTCFLLYYKRLPKGVVAFASYMITKYGLNYKAMVRDEKNYDQETWRQFRAKIRKFMCIPEQFGPFLTQSNINIEQLDLDEYGTDQE